MFANIQKAIGVLLIVAGFFVVFMDAPREVLGQTLRIITPTQGGTGIGSTTAGNIGNCLKVSDEAPFTYELGACGSGSSGGGGVDNNWAWNSANNFVYSDSASTTATTSARSYFFTGTSTTDANTFPLASTTALTATRAYLTQLANLTGNGFVKTGSGNGTLSIDTTTYESGLTSSNGITRTVNNFAPTTGYNIPLTASTTNWESFYLTPSGRITAGTGIDWSGNTLNGVYTAGVGLTLNTEDFVCDTASGSTFGCLSSADWTAFNSKGVSNWIYNGSRLTPSTTVGITVNATSTLATTSISRLLLQLATTTKQSVGGGGPESITNMRTNTNDLMLWSGLNSDTEGRFLIETNGFMGWGAGGSTDQDMSLYRSGVGGLAAQSFTDNSTDAFRVNQVDGSAVLTVNTTSEYVSTPWLLVNGAGGGAKMDVYGGGTTAIRAEQPSASDVAFSAFVTSDTQLRFSFLADGTQKWGSGSLAGDTQLYRTGAGHLSIIPAGASTEARLGIGSTTPSRALTVAGDIIAANITATGSATSTVSFFSGLGTFTNSVVNTLLTAASAVFTGLVDIGAGVLEIPNGSAPTVDSIGELAIDSTSNQLVLYGSAKKVIGNGNQYSSFTYATSTAWTGTTTIPLGTAYVAETWNGIQCFTDAGTLNVSVSDGTNRMNANAASTTVGTTVFTTNNTFTANEKRYVDIGTPASSPTKISCTVSKSITAD